MKGFPVCTTIATITICTAPGARPSGPGGNGARCSPATGRSDPTGRSVRTAPSAPTGLSARAGPGERAERHREPSIERASVSLFTAVAQRLRQRDEDEDGDVALRIAELLDEAAQKIERL